METLFPLRRALELKLFTVEQLQECRREQEEAHRAGRGFSLTQALLRRGWLRMEEMDHLLKDRAHPLHDLPSLSRYEIQAWLGEGAAGMVYRAWDRELKRPVAIKILRDFGGLSGRMRERFRGEARAAAGLAHPNLVAVYDVGEEGGVLFLVMELVEGSLLSDILNRQTLAPREIARLLEKIARGVAAAHERGIVHRDLKPANVLVTQGGEPKVFDFGLALVQGEAAASQSTAMAGTPLYMAPEQITRRPSDLTPATDVFALGTLLYEALTGNPPHRAESVAKVYAKILGEPPKPPRIANPGVPRDLETLCLKALEKDPARRYADARAMAEDLRRHLSGEPILARPVGVLARGWGRVRRHPWGAMTAALGILGLLGAGILAGRAHLQRLDASRWAAVGDRARAQNQWGVALAAYERAHALHPADAEWERDRDEMARRVDSEERRLRGQKDAAEAALRIREASQELDKLRLRAYQPHWRLTDEEFATYRKFSDDCLALMNQTGPTGEGWWVVGRVRQVFGDGDAALEAYARGLQAEPDHGRCLLSRARLLIERALLRRVTAFGDPRGAPEVEPWVVEALGLLDRGTRTEKIPEFDRDLAHAYGRLARGTPIREFSAEMMAKWSSADFSEEFQLVRGLGEVFELVRGNDALSQFLRVTVKGGALAQAATDALRIRSRFPEALLWRGVARVYSDNRKGALEDFRLALEINPRYAEAHFALG
ncbi:MAG TPA: serine/threonine-protein kinase, partial [Planctomycetota bacterium]|nr:serine/threonine-protein kinase [Planctomycetota bacterium]